MKQIKVLVVDDSAYNRKAIAEILEGRDGGGAAVRWVDARPRSIAIGASPIDIAAPFREGVLFRIPSAVLTSATLGVGEDFSFMERELGVGRLGRPVVPR